MRVLVTGAGGLLGGRIAALLHDSGAETLAGFRSSPPPPGPRAVRLDLDDGDALARLFDSERPDAVVHAAALAHVDACFADPTLAEATNSGLPGRLARACHERACRLIAVSTDLVFSGERAPLSEADPPRPLGAYGRTKLAGEQAVLDACPAAAVVRVSLVLGRGHGTRATASESIVWAIRAGRPARLFTDEYRTPVDPESIVDGLTRLLPVRASGLFHLGGGERVSRHELGLRVARVFDLPPALLRATKQADHDAREPRPADVSLDSTRARRELGWQPRPLEQAIRESRLRP